MKRVTVNLSDSDYLILKRLSSLNGTSMSKIVGELVQTVTPILAQMVENIESIQKAEDGLKDKLRISAEQAHEQLSHVQQDAMRIFSQYSADMAKQIDFIVEQEKAAAREMDGEAGAAPSSARAAASSDAERDVQPPYNNMGVRSKRVQGGKV